MRKVIFVLVILLILMVVGCKPDTEGSKTCVVDSDCIPVGDCNPGCWSEKPYSKDTAEDVCGFLEPPSCKCVSNVCYEYFEIPNKIAIGYGEVKDISISLVNDKEITLDNINLKVVDCTSEVGKSTFNPTTILVPQESIKPNSVQKLKYRLDPSEMNIGNYSCSIEILSNEEVLQKTEFNLIITK